MCKKEGGIKRKNRGYKGTTEEKKQRQMEVNQQTTTLTIVRFMTNPTLQKLNFDYLCYYRLLRPDAK